jgi:alpha-beta hydrolase superfamily lysophospholipase
MRIELEIDVTEAAGLGEPATIALTVEVPDVSALPRRPIVCFAKPGGGYSRRYFTADLPGPGTGSQAAWHTERGWIFVSVDHLGVGDSSTNHDGTRLTYGPVVAANRAAEQEVLRLLEAGDLAGGFPPITDALKLGIGQSMGGCLTVVQQGRYHCYDGIGVLGFSAVHTHPPTAPGTAPIRAPWIPRDAGVADGIVTNAPALDSPEAGLAERMEETGHAMAWAFHYDDVDQAVVDSDLTDFPLRNGKPPPWASITVPLATAVWCLAPGAIAPEAASVTTPVLVAVGERDVIADPRGEARAYLSSPSVDLFICPRMGHMHNFAGTRERLWRRIETWATWVQQSMN